MRQFSHVLRLTAVLALFTATGAFAGHRLPNFDAVGSAPPLTTATSRARVMQAGPSVMPVEWHTRLAVPTFIWFGDRTSASTARTASTAVSMQAAARTYLAQNAAAWGLDFADSANAVVAGVHDTGRGAVIVKFKQEIDGVEVFRDALNVAMTRDRALVAMSGYLAPSRLAPSTAAVSSTGARTQSATLWTLSPAGAISAAAADLAPDAGSLDPSRFAPTGITGSFTRFETTQMLEGGVVMQPVHVRKVWFHLPDHLEPAYHVTLEIANTATTDSDAYSYVISATDGRLLFRNDLIADADPTPVTYKVWAAPDGIHRPLNGPQGYGGSPHPNGTNDGYQAPFTSPNLITLAYGPISTRDRWLPEGATVTTGNNVDAYVDIKSPDGFTEGGDTRGAARTANTFDNTYDLQQLPGALPTQHQASITQLFYDINFFHDWYYDHGFNEAAGNAQADNFGRGGVAGDPIRGESQDYSGRNNANMFTPADGLRPRMQMYIFDGRPKYGMVVGSPSGLAGSYNVGLANFGLQAFDVTGDVVRPNPADACRVMTAGSLVGKIALVDRGNCPFSDKSGYAQAAGAIGVIIGNVSDSPSPETLVTMTCLSTTSCTGAELSFPPTFHVPLSVANSLRDQLTKGSLRVTLKREVKVDRDGSLDTAIVAHEWAHYLSNRLVGNADGLVSQQSRGMGEGWSDFAALLLMVRPEDMQVPSNANVDGVYAVAGYALAGGGNGLSNNSAYYFGIRRVPYSTNLTINPLTYKHITNGEALAGAPVRYGQDGADNAEVHNTGEVWATMLWESYAALLRDTLGSNPRLTFAQAQSRMKDYLVASLKLTPNDPTILEARNALLAVAYANDPADFQRIWESFAKRGAGVKATAGDRFSFTNKGGTEDFSVARAVVVDSQTLDDSVTGCNSDGMLEGGETGLLRITVRNSGTGRLQATTARVTSSDSRLTFENNGAVSVPATNPGEKVTVSVKTTLARTSDTLLPTVTIGLTDPEASSGAELKSTWQPRLNTRAEAKQSSTDDFESPRSAWTVTANPIGATTSIPVWSLTALGTNDQVQFGRTRIDAANDSSLVSPTLVVSESEPFGFTFRHRHSFDETSDASGKLIPLDGGVIEISVDDGVTWSDIGNFASPGYSTTTIATNNGSPLEGRRAYSGDIEGTSVDAPLSTPFQTVSVNLGNLYAGTRVKVRFRMGTGRRHTGFSFAGWQIDDVKFTGIKNLPFYAMVPGDGICGVRDSSTTVRPSVSNPTIGQAVTLEATVGLTGTQPVTPTLPPTGTVDWFENGVLLGSSRIVGGKATWTTKFSTTGAHSISATYNGTTNFRPSSGSATMTVGQSSGTRRRAAGH